VADLTDLAGEEWCPRTWGVKMGNDHP